MSSFTVSHLAMACVLAPVGLGIISLSPAHAEDVDNRSLLEEIVVTGDRTGSATAPGIEDIRQKMTRIPGSVALIDAESFSKIYAENLGDMLSFTPGVFAQKRYAEEIRLSIRGSGISRSFHVRGIELLMDGVPITLADGTGDFQEIDSRLSRYLTVFKGGNGLEYGAASLGGAINVVTPTGRTATANNSLIVEGGSFGTIRGTATMARAGQGWDFFTGLSTIHSSQFRDHSDQETYRFTGNMGLQVSDRVETRFYLTANHIDQEIPGTLSLAQIADRPSQAVDEQVINDNARDIRSLRFSNKTSIRVGTESQLDLGAYFTIRDLDHPIFVFIDDETTDYGGFARYTTTAQIAGMTHQIAAGINGRASRTNDDWFVNQGGKRGFQIRDSVQRANTLQAYVSDQIYLTDTFALDLAVQAFSARREIIDPSDASREGSETFEAINPKFGILWDPTPEIQAWANITRAKEAPTFGDLSQAPIPGFVDIASQDAWTAELGTRGARGVLAWDITIFRAWIDGEMLQFSTDTNIPASTFNADDTIHQGLEAGFHLTMLKDRTPSGGDRLTLNGAYSFNDFKFDGDAQFGNNILPVVPRHVMNTELRYEQKDRFHVALSLEWVPKGPFVDYANTMRSSDYAVLGVSAGVTLMPGITAYVDMQNLADKKYASNFAAIISAQDPGTNLNIFYPGDGFGVFAGIKAEF